MKTLFYALLILQGIAEIYMIVRFMNLKNTNLIGRIVCPFVFYLLLFLTCKWLKVYIPYYSLALILLTVFIDSFVGQYLDCYKKSQTFDRYLHAFGSFSNALFVYFIFKGLVLFNGSKTFVALFVFVIGLALGSVFEIVELAMDKIQKSHSQKGLQDTDFDLIFNLIGSLAAFLFAYVIF